MKKTFVLPPLLVTTCMLSLAACGTEGSKKDDPSPSQNGKQELKGQELEKTNTGKSPVLSDKKSAPPKKPEEGDTIIDKPLDTTGIVVDAEAYKFNEIYQDHTVTLDLETGKAMFLSRFSTRLLFGRRVRLSSEASVLVNGQALRYSDGSEADVLALFMPFFGTLLAQSVKDIYILESTAQSPGARLDWSVLKGTQALSSSTWSMPGFIAASLPSQTTLTRSTGFTVPYVSPDLTNEDKIECELATAEPSVGSTDANTDTVKIADGKAGVCGFEAADVAAFRTGKARLVLSRRRSSLDGRIYLSSKVQAAPVNVIVK